MGEDMSIDTKTLEPVLKQTLHEGIRPQITDALQLAVKHQAETGFLIYAQLEEGKRRLKVWTGDIIIGNKAGVPLDPQFNILRELADIIAKQPLDKVIYAVQKTQYQRHPDMIGDFHVHLSPKAPINLADMIQTMLANGLITVLGQPLSKRYAKITYLTWNPTAPKFNEILAEAIRKVDKAMVSETFFKQAGDYAENILHSQIVTQHLFGMKYAK